jgi:trans-aconitate methyltransferase
MSPLFLGCYEHELHNDIEQVIASRPTRIVDVGCAEGYYAVGLAIRLPEATVHAFDISDAAQEICREAAQINGVSERVRVAGLCTAADLERLSGPGSFFLLDCEGAELELLDLDLAPGLRDTEIIVELHDFVDASITPMILERFRTSHEIHLRTSTDRDPSLVPALQGLSADLQQMAVAEGRPTEPHPMQWARLIPRSARSKGRRL